MSDSRIHNGVPPMIYSNAISTRTQGVDQPTEAEVTRVMLARGYSLTSDEHGEFWHRADDAQPVAPCKCRRLGDWDGFSHHPLCDMQPARTDATHDAALKVWYGSMPESNGKTNFTAILHRGDITAGYTIDRSEYPDRVRYEADRVRWLIGETEKEPCILDYDGDKRSDYVAPATPAKVEAWMHRTTGALLHEQSKDLCDGRRNSGVWMPLGEVQR